MTSAAADCKTIEVSPQFLWFNRSRLPEHLASQFCQDETDYIFPRVTEADIEQQKAEIERVFSDFCQLAEVRGKVKEVYSQYINKFAESGKRVLHSTYPVTIDGEAADERMTRLVECTLRGVWLDKAKRFEKRVDGSNTGVAETVNLSFAEFILNGAKESLEEQFQTSSPVATPERVVRLDTPTQSRMLSVFGKRGREIDQTEPPPAFQEIGDAEPTSPLEDTDETKPPPETEQLKWIRMDKPKNDESDELRENPKSTWKHTALRVALAGSTALMTAAYLYQTEICRWINGDAPEQTTWQWIWGMDPTTSAVPGWLCEN